MSIRSRKNQYRGVNAHLHSHLQARGEWESFHGNYISFLGAALNSLLPQGYIARTERSIQIREFHPDTGKEILVRKKPDVAIYRQTPTTPVAVFVPAIAPTQTLTVEDTLPTDPDAFLRSAVVYQLLPDQTLGKAITQIEILSPTNKPPNAGYLQYIHKRESLLRSQINLVEVDFLHETDSPIEGVVSYPRQENGAFPYTITIDIPHPTVKEGPVWIYGFSADEPIPALDIPLEESTTVKLNFGGVYNQTFESFNFGYTVDYEQLPENFKSYNPADQARIQRRMKAVQVAHASGVNLDENAPIPLEEGT